MSKFIELSETIKFVNERIETKELNLKIIFLRKICNLIKGA